MVLDAVLATPHIPWLATEREKVAYCCQQRGLDGEDLPALTVESRGRRTTRYFPHKLPLGLRSTGDEVTLLYLVADPAGGRFGGSWRPIGVYSSGWRAGASYWSSRAC
ncbi:MAG: hypothetical protein ACRD2X_02895 [Vicinamibacteraceae bacterium]